jgi:endoglucanase
MVMLRNEILPLLLVLPLTACGRPATPTDAKTSGAGAGPPPSAGPVLVDDFEDGDGTSLLGGDWYTYVDQGNGGLSTLDVPRQGGAMRMEGEGFESKRSLQVKFRLDQGKLPYPPYVGIGVGLKAPYTDLRPYGALQYTYKGGKHQVRIETTNVEQWDFYAVDLPASEAWRTVTLDFSLFQQGGWGPKVPFALESTKALGWQVRGDTGDAGDFQLDNVRLLPPGAVGPRAPNLEVRAPEPPAPTELASIAITNPLQTVARQYLDDGYNLTNWLEEKRFSDFGSYDEAFVQRLAQAGFKGLRLPVDLDRYVVRRGKDGDRVTVEVHPDLFKVLDAFDRWTSAHGLSLTIDYHQYDHSYIVDDPQSTGEMVALWGKVAEHFAKNPRPDLFYELLNEPELAAGKRGPTAAEWTRLSEAMIAAIRQHDPKRPILFGDVKWYGLDELTARTPFPDPNIIYVFHFYEPFIFTHQGAPWAGLGTTHDVPFPYVPERWPTHQEDLGFTELNARWQLDQLHDYYRNGNREALRNRLVTVKSWAVRHNVPIICNEFGVHQASARQEDVVRYYTDLIGLFRELEIPWQIWFMIMDAKTGAIDPQIRQALQLVPRG